jgi:two-component system response regulator LytT
VFLQYLHFHQTVHYLLDYSLEHLEELLDPDQFFRINRQYLIRYSAIRRIHILSKSRIKLKVQPVPQRRPPGRHRPHPRIQVVA